MAQPAHLVAVPVRTSPRWGEFVPPPVTEIDRPETTHISRAALPRAGRWVFRVLVLALAIGGPLLAFAGQHDVTVDVDGVVKKVRTYATDATSLLQREGVKIAKDDLVTPSTKLKDGARVTFRRAKQVRLVLDGERQTVTARGLTVGQALKDLGMRPGPKDHVFPSEAALLQPGLEIFVRNAIHAKLRVDGRLRDVVSSADTIDNLLEQADVAVGPDDYVLPARKTEPTDGMWIRVVRVRRITEERSVRVPYRVVTQHDAEMESGVRKIVQQGSEGLKVQHYAVVLEDGTRVSTRLVDERVLRTARDHVVRVGTKEPTFKGGGGSQSGLASWFEAEGLVAAHRSLPMGSVVKVTDAGSGKSVSVRINQRGPWVEGRVIDLSDDAFQRLAPLGQGTIKVTVQS
jgi:uncharacterized protein YabE (DUF348 family)